MKLPPEAGNTLVAIARAAIEHALGMRRRPPLTQGAAWLENEGASFVTLRTRKGALRGCIGSLWPRRPLGEDVAENAVAAALRDPRFAPLTPDELADVRIEVSVLGKPEPIEHGGSEEALLAAIQPYKDGIILEWGAHRATFLPQVWHEIPDPRAFLAALKRKAGLSSDFWAPDVRIWRYHVQKFEERDDS